MKRKRIIAFYDVLLYAIICGPMIVIAIMTLFAMLIHGAREGVVPFKMVLILAIAVSIPSAVWMLFRFCILDKDTIYFYYYPFARSLEKAANNIDIKWNQKTYISEIIGFEIVKLTKEEKQTKVYYKHWFNKYLKISLRDGNTKYVYVGNYSNFQIRRIIKYVEKRNSQNSTENT